jgi:uncharacterized protein (TIGR03437 family)
MNLRQNRSLLAAAAWAVFGLAGAQGQTQDTSGNGTLKGNFQFRNVAVTNVDDNNNPTEVTATYGAIVFDGNGNYTITGTQVDNTVSNGTPQAYNVTGTYGIGANGIGYITSPLFPADNTGVYFEYGAVSLGVFVGSATESGSDGAILNDTFIAIPTGAAPTNASFTSTYQTGLLDFTGGGSASIFNALFSLSPNGKGGLAIIALNGQASNQNATTLTQSISGGTYNFNSNGSATLTIPLPSATSSTNALFTGTKTVYESADGNFILGWTTAGYDVFFGIKGLAAPTATNSISQGLYFTSALEDAFFVGGWGTDSYFGSEYNTGDTNGDTILHQRLNAFGIYGLPNGVDYGTDDSVLLNPNGSATDFYYNYLFGDGGSAYVGIGTGGFFSLVVGLHAPTLSGSGVFINPVMIYNAASFQPVTASLSPGELITLFGTGLATTTTSVQGGQSVPRTLGGVSATIDNIPCPVFAVSPGQISILVPYELDTLSSAYANIQVTSNGTKSNVVQMYFQDSSPAAFSLTENGLGFAAVRHAATGATVTQTNPATAGEYISIYMTGLGTVTPALTADGLVASSTTLSNADINTEGELSVFFNDYTAGSLGNPGTIQFAGLTPGLAALYQINVLVPSGVLGPGDDVELEFLTDMADVNQIYIPFGPGAPEPPTGALRAAGGAAPLVKRPTMEARAARAKAIRELRMKAAAKHRRAG